jgi:GT2 family glycosyltransferase
LASVLKQRGVRFELVVIDNASTDNTLKLLRSAGPNVHVLANSENVGFGRACNQGFLASSGRFIFLLNPDAWLEGEESLLQLCRAMEQNINWGLAGTRVTEPDGVTESPPASFYPDQHRLQGQFAKLPGNIAWVLGASMFVRREVFSAVEGFDPGFFLTSEETDLCLRIRQQGWEIGFVREVTVRHIGFASEMGIDPYLTWLRRVPGIYRFWSKHFAEADARRLLWKDWIRASLRRQWYGTLAKFLGRESIAWNKHRRYAGISEAAWRFLSAKQEKQCAPREKLIPLQKA